VLPLRLLRTTSFRLTLLYAALFSASVLILFAVIYLSAAFDMTGQLDGTINTDANELERSFELGGTDRVADAIRGRVEQMPNGPIYYLLEDAHGTPIAGNVPAMPPKPGRFTFEADGPGRFDVNGRLLRGHGAMLSDGNYLLVAGDAQSLRNIKDTILRAFAGSIVITLLLAFGGGALASGRVRRSVESINRTARAIMAGNLSDRIPVRGVGDEFDDLAKSLNEMLARTEASIEGMRQVTNDIAHDLRTPLTRLRHRLELAERKATTAEELRAAVGRSIKDTDGILETFGALLRIAELESGAQRGSFAPVDLTELLWTIVEVYQPSAKEKAQAVTVEIAPGLRMEGDRQLLARLLANLVENAMRHSPERARITVSALQAADAIEVVIADDGPGIPAAERANVFRRFYRLESSRTTPGSGLGLSLVAAVAAIHSIEVSLEDNQPGLRVRLKIPRPSA